jgi:ketosteroid isomerase-like protein
VTEHPAATDDATRVLVRELFASYARGEGERVAALLDDNVDWTIHGPRNVFPFVGQRHGKADVLKVLAEIANDYAVQRYEPDIIIVENERAAVLSNVAFVQRATNRTLSFHIVDFLRFRDGRVVEFREFTDTFDLVEQALGRFLIA